MTFGNETVTIGNMSDSESKSYSDTRRASPKSMSAAKRDAHGYIQYPINRMHERYLNYLKFMVQNLKAG